MSKHQNNEINWHLTICLSTDNLFINKKKLITTNINKTIVFLENDSVSDCCLMPIQQFFSYIMTRTSLFSMRWWWGPLCTRPTHWVVFYSASSLKQQCRSTRTHYPDSEPTSLCSFSLMLHAYQRSNKYQFYSLWLDPIGLEPMIYRTRGKQGFKKITNTHIPIKPKTEVPLLHAIPSSCI
jgi:hypothetical protein